MSFRLRPLVLAAGLVAAAAAPAAAQVVSITSTLTTSQSWGPGGSVVGNTFWIKNSVAINPGVTLTVQPGVVVKFNPGAYLVVDGTLRAIGTVADTIVFTSIRDDNNRAGDTNGDGTSTSPAPADWGAIQFPSGGPNNSRLHLCDIRYGGSGLTGALQFQSASDSVTSCVVRRSYFGVDCQGTSAPVLQNTSIEASTQTPIVLDFTATPVFSSLVFSSSDNGFDAIGLRGGTLTGTAVLPQRGATVGVNPASNVTYVLLGGLSIPSGSSLTVNPGVVIKPVGGVGIVVGGNLTMVGSPATGDTITVTSLHDDNFGVPGDTESNGSILSPNRGDWNRIVFQPGATGSIQYCRLKFGTNSGSQGVVEMTGLSIGVSNCLITDAAHAVAMFGISAPTLANLQINNCSSTPTLMSVTANPTFTNLSFLANGITALGVQGEDVSVDARLPVRTVAGFVNITYYLMNGMLHMVSPATLRIDPGVVIKSQLSGGGMQIDGALVANGKPDSVIVFTSERDNIFGNPADTNGDGSSTQPGQGDWTYVHFTATTNDADSRINWCRFQYGADGPFDGYPNTLWITSAAPPVTNTLIFKSAYGMRIDGNSTPLVDSVTFDNCSLAPIVMSALSDPQITTHNTYSTNGYNALALLAETISQNATLKYRPGVGNAACPTFAYLPTGTITVASGVTLAIQPQVVLKPTSSFVLFGVNGALNIVGSDNGTGRVFITSRRDDALGGDATPTDGGLPGDGDWGDIEFYDTSVDAQCVVRNAKFQFGAGGGNTAGVLSTFSASPTFANLEFFQNRTAFTFNGPSQPGLDSLNIFNCTQLPIVASLVSNPSYGAHITFANDSYLCLGILGETIAQNVRTRIGRIGAFPNLNYALAGNVSIAFGAKWTIDPGVVIKMGRIFSGDPMGLSINVDGAIAARGKPDSLIVFTSSADDAFGQDLFGDGAATKPLPGNWLGISFSPVSNDTATAIDWCRFRYGGYSNGVLTFTSAGPTISNTTFTSSSTSPAWIAGASTPTFANCNFDSTSAGPPITLSLVSDPVFTNCQLLGNRFLALGVIPENIAQDVLWKIRPVGGRNNMPFLLNGTLTVGLGATMTIQPGVQVKLQGGSIVIQRALTAVGRTDSLIVFTSYRDDFYGGDTNTDSTATAPAPGDWGWVYVDGTAIDAQVNFRDCVFRYGGSGTLGALRCVNSSPAVDSCLFAYNATGVSVEGSSNPSIRHSSLYGNQQFAVVNAGNAFCVNAQNDWWGAASGPNDASATADLCLLGANAGSGDAVSNNVDYTNFLTSGLQNPLLGDVSLNGQVLAYDASLTLQAVVSLITLTPLQTLVADVSGTNGVTAFDASLILQYVAGAIAAFPAAANHLGPAPPDVAAVRREVAAARGTFAVALDPPQRDGADWVVPVRLTGTAPAWSLELRLAGDAAGTLAAVEPADAGALHAERVGAGEARVALAAVAPLPTGEVARLRFPAGAGAFTPPALVAARVNESAAGGPVPPPAPAVTALSAPWPNPARDGAALELAIASADAGARVSVRVVDLAGRTVRTLVDGPLAPGVHPLRWDLADAAGRAVPAGLYFVHARAGSWSATHRVIVVR